MSTPVQVTFDTWAPWTRYTYWEHLAGYFGWATSAGHLDWSPMSGLVRPPYPHLDPHPATEQDVAIAMGMARPWRTAVILAAFQGLRAAEIALLDRTDGTDEWVRVVRKDGKEQLLPVHPVVLAEYADLPPGPMLRTARGTRFSPAYLSQAVHRELTRAGLPPELTLHWFRHRFATRALLPRDLGGAGADIRTVQDLLGHASVRSTQIYTQVTDRQRRAAVANLPVPTENRSRDSV